MSLFSLPEKSTRDISEFEFVADPKDKFAQLGAGAFATVKLAREKSTGKLFALKIASIHPKRSIPRDIESLISEITIHRKLDHENIVKYHDYMQTENHAYVILDYAENGSLYKYHEKKKQLNETEIFRFFYQTCSAIEYLHKNNVMHRDIKPENLLLDSDLNIKLCDFGWATQNINDKRVTFCGTYEYMAPEIIQKTPYDYRVDIWSLGVLLFELIHNEAPYKGRTLPEITRSIAARTINFSPDVKPGAKDLILSILQINPTERPSIEKILNHPWVLANLKKYQPPLKQVARIQSPLEKPKVPENTTSESPNIIRSIKKFFTYNNPKKSDSSPSNSLKKPSDNNNKNLPLNPLNLNSAKPAINIKTDNNGINLPWQSGVPNRASAGLTTLSGSEKSTGQRKRKIFANKSPRGDLQCLDYPPTSLEDLEAMKTITTNCQENNDSTSFGGLAEIRKKQNMANRHITITTTTRPPLHDNSPLTTTHLESKATLSVFNQISGSFPMRQPETPAARTERRGIFENDSPTPTNAHGIVRRDNRLRTEIDFHKKSPFNNTSNRSSLIQTPSPLQTQNKNSEGHKSATTLSNFKKISSNNTDTSPMNRDRADTAESASLNQEKKSNSVDEFLCDQISDPYAHNGDEAVAYMIDSLFSVEQNRA